MKTQRIIKNEVTNEVRQFLTKRIEMVPTYWDTIINEATQEMGIHANWINIHISAIDTWLLKQIAKAFDDNTSMTIRPYDFYNIELEIYTKVTFFERVI